MSESLPYSDVIVAVEFRGSDLQIDALVFMQLIDELTGKKSRVRRIAHKDKNTGEWVQGDPSPYAAVTVAELTQDERV